jgi:hypothetical protein
MTSVKKILLCVIRNLQKNAVASDTPHQPADNLLKMLLNDQLQLIAKAGEQ